MTRERIEPNGNTESSNLSRDKVSRDEGRMRSGPNGRTDARISGPDADSYSFPIALEEAEEARFLRTQKRVPVRRGTLDKKTANRLKTTVLVALTVATCGCLAAAAYDYGMHAERFRIESSDDIEISGVHNASRTHVMEVFRSDISKNIFYISLEERKRQLEEIPWVKSATVMRLLPNRLGVSIVERTPVAFVLIGSKTSLIDAGGAIVGPSASRQTTFTFPVVRGITETEPLSSRAAVMKIYNQLMRELESAGPDKHFSQQLSEVDLSDPKDVKATVSDEGGTVLLHLGESDFLERYKLFAEHIGEWRRQYHNVRSVDLRYEGQVIVNPESDRLPGAQAQAQAQPPATLQTASLAAPAASHPARKPGQTSRRKKGK